MNADAEYSTVEFDAQKNLTLEFSRRARGIPVWAGLHAHGRSGLEELIDAHCRHARRLAEGVAAAGFEVLNRVLLNQVLARGRDESDTAAILARIQNSGELWFGSTRWRDRAAFRISVSSWRATEEDVERAIRSIEALRRNTSPHTSGRHAQSR